ncbi:MAG: hypothetical protein H8E70_07125 [Candidatus Marinimicrobia bacterium]|nr:hypothetical protein [Candidatus Neomarinimicrobiota bacterium]
MSMKNTLSAKQIYSSHIDALDFSIDIDSLQINVLLINLLILVIIGLAVQIA